MFYKRSHSVKTDKSMSLYKQLQYKERDCKSAYLFRACYVTTNLVTSLEFNPIRCATILCHSGQTRNISVATRFTVFSSTAPSSATSE